MENVAELIRPLLADIGMSLYGVEWLVNEKPPLLRIMIECVDRPVDLEACVQATDVISQALDQADFFQHEYHLEVCSPGAERPLLTDQQRQQAIGQYVYLKLANPKEGIDQTYGTLQAATDHDITIQYRVKTRTKTLTVQLEDVALLRTAVKV